MLNLLPRVTYPFYFVSVDDVDNLALINLWRNGDLDSARVSVSTWHTPGFSMVWHGYDTCIWFLFITNENLKKNNNTLFFQMKFYGNKNLDRPKQFITFYIDYDYYR